MIRFAIYGRHSTEMQNPQSAEDQIASVREDVRRRHSDWEDCGRFFKDEAVSGRSLAGRRAFEELLALAKTKPRPFDVILVEDISRAFRNREEAVRIRAELRPYRVRILSMAEGYVDPESETGLWVTGVKELKAEADSMEIARRTKRGQRRQAERGFSAGRPTNFGYRRRPLYDGTAKDRDGNPRRIGVTLEPDPETAPAVRKIFELFATEGWGLKRIAFALNEPTNGFCHLKPRGFCPTFVRSVLQNRAYLGEMIYNLRSFYRSSEGRRRYRLNPADEWIVRKDAHPALVDRETFERAQTLFAARTATGRFPRGGGLSRNARHLLSGLLRCADCGAPMVARTSGRRAGSNAPKASYIYYVCGIRQRRGPNACPNDVSIPLGEADRWVLDTVDEHVLDEGAIEFVETERRRILLEAIEERGRGDGDLEREVSRVERDIAHLVHALKQGLPPRSIREELERLEERRRALVERARASEGLRAALETEIDRHLASRAIRHSRDILASGNPFHVRQELAEHVLEMSAAPDGVVRMVTRAHSLFGEIEKLLGATFGGAREEGAAPLTGLVAGAGFEPATSGL